MNRKRSGGGTVSMGLPLPTVHYRKSTEEPHDTCPDCDQGSPTIAASLAQIKHQQHRDFNLGISNINPDQVELMAKHTRYAYTYCLNTLKAQAGE